MALYSNAFKKVMLGTGSTHSSGTTTNWLVTTAGMDLGVLSQLGKGYVAIVNPTTWLTVNPGSYTGNFIIVNTSPFLSDTYGNHSGYQIPDMSKMINPGLVELAYYSNPADAAPFVFQLGGTGYYNQQGCTPTFYCDQTYTFRLDLNGSPILRQYVRNMYRYYTIKTPCCTPGQPSAVIDPTWVFIQLATMIAQDNYVNQFVYPIVVSNGATGTPPFTNYGPPPSLGLPRPDYVSPSILNWSSYSLGTTVQPQDVEAGIILGSAYVSTKTGDCSFMQSDFYEIAPVEIGLSIVDFNGNPCESLNYCHRVIQPGFIGNGYGDTAQKDYLLSQAYLQNYLSDDVRIREVNGSADMLIDRTQKYARIGIIHTIPRFLGVGAAQNNVYNTDRYVIDIISNVDFIQNSNNAMDLLENFFTAQGITVHNYNSTYAPIISSSTSQQIS